MKETDIKLINGDCLLEMQEIPSKSIDMVLADPPYGTTSCKWDSVIPLKQMWEQLNRITKPYKAMVLFSQQPFTTMLNHSNIDQLKYDWIWYKTKAGNFQQAPNQPLRKHEVISVFSSGVVGHESQTKKRMPYNPQNTESVDLFVQRKKTDGPHGYHRKNGVIKGFKQTRANYPDTILEYGSVHNPPHPTQKPVALMEYLIKTYTNEGETVLDFTMGSGTTGVAAKKLNRNFVGIELDHHYFNIAKERISESKMEQSDESR